MESIWSQSCQIEERDPMPGDIQTDVAIIGAGMTGILTAHRLQQAGIQAVVLEANRIASGQTRNTTAKITAQHGLIYHQLIKNFGVKKAEQYAMANANAVTEYRRIIDANAMDCDFEETSAYLYADSLEELQKEAAAAKQLGLCASVVEGAPAPIPAAGAIKMEQQAQFHPLKFLQAISRPLTIYENTSVQSVEGHLLVTNRGKVEAKKVVFACHFPFVNFPGLYFARMHQERSYVLALENAAAPEGMWIGAGGQWGPAYSLRRYKNLVLLGGESHRAGENPGGRYEALRQRAREWFPKGREVAHWSAQDCIPADHAPYIGRYAASQPNWYVATGFQKWGMTSAMVAAMILCDAICGKEHPCAGVFAPDRLVPQGVPQIAGEGGQAVKGLVKRIFQIPQEKAQELPVGHGGVVLLEGDKVGVYKDENGAIYAVDIRCPHLGCQLEWNPDELSWDCPCHGSRFDYRGRLISGPAQEDLNHA